MLLTIVGLDDALSVGSILDPLLLRGGPLHQIEDGVVHLGGGWRTLARIISPAHNKKTLQCRPEVDHSIKDVFFDVMA